LSRYAASQVTQATDTAEHLQTAIKMVCWFSARSAPLPCRPPCGRTDAGEKQGSAVRDRERRGKAVDHGSLRSGCAAIEPYSPGCQRRTETISVTGLLACPCASDFWKAFVSEQSSSAAATQPSAQRAQLRCFSASPHPDASPRPQRCRFSTAVP